MRNLLNFIWLHHFTIVFLVLELIGFYLLVNFNDFHQSKVQQSSVAISGRLYEWQNAYGQYVGLIDENDKLRETNAKLIDEQLNVQDRVQLRRLGDFTVVVAEAIQSTYHLENNYIIINAGSEQGIKPASAVIDNDGVIGIIHSTSANYSSILPLIHSQSQISARLNSTEYFGQCRWTGIDEQYIMLENIPNHVEVDSDQVVITRGGGGVFPPGIIIGAAESSQKDESSGFQEIKVRLASDFRKVSSLYVIQNSHKTEYDSLMQSTSQWID